MSALILFCLHHVLNDVHDREDHLSQLKRVIGLHGVTFFDQCLRCQLSEEYMTFAVYMHIKLLVLNKNAAQLQSPLRLPKPAYSTFRYGIEQIDGFNSEALPTQNTQNFHRIVFHIASPLFPDQFREYWTGPEIFLKYLA